MSLHLFSIFLQIITWGALAALISTLVAEYIYKLPSIQDEKHEELMRCIKFYFATIFLICPGFSVLFLDWSSIKNPFPSSAFAEFLCTHGNAVSLTIAVLFFLMAIVFLVRAIVLTVEYVQEYR